jgi:hypothetical protein
MRAFAGLISSVTSPLRLLSAVPRSPSSLTGVSQCYGKESRGFKASVVFFGGYFISVLVSDNSHLLALTAGRTCILICAVMNAPVSLEVVKPNLKVNIILGVITSEQYIFRTHTLTTCSKNLNQETHAIDLS